MALNSTQIQEEIRKVEARSLRDRQLLDEARLKLERTKTEADRTRTTTVFRQTPVRVEVTTANSPFTPKDNQLVVCDMSAGDITITLPTQSTYGITIKRETAANTLTVNPGSGRLINNSSTITIGGDQTALELSFDGSDWHIT